MAENTLRAMCRQRDLKAGHFIVEFCTPGIGHIMAAAGCDFVLFDMEHSGFDIATVRSGLRYFEAASVPTIVRVPSNQYHHIARACDMGVEGLMVPMVGTAQEAEAIVASMKYHPDGARGVALQVAHDRFRPAPVAEALGAANDRTALFALIETAEGVENVEAIAAVPGVDCLWVGHFDLSASLGIPGQFDNRKFMDAMDRIVQAAKAHDKALGRLVPTVDQGVEQFADGFDFICYSGDAWVLRDALHAALDQIRAKVARPS